MIEEIKKDDNIIFIGMKPFMNYVNGVIMQFSRKENKEVIIKARGKFISRAVDIAEVTLKRFLKDKIRILERFELDHIEEVDLNYLVSDICNVLQQVCEEIKRNEDL